MTTFKIIFERNGRRWQHGAGSSNTSGIQWNDRALAERTMLAEMRLDPALAGQVLTAQEADQLIIGQ